MNMTNQITSLSLEVAASKAPAIMASSPASYTTDKYNFMPTTEIISYMNDLGYILTDAKQASSNINLRKDHGMHIVCFQHPDLYVKDNENNVEARPQIVITNSHDGTKKLTFDMGLFRLICSNGLVIKDKDLGYFKEQHNRITFNQVKELIAAKVEILPKTVDKINVWNGREMSQAERQAFAKDAIQLRTGTDRQVMDHEIFSVLEPRRKADAPDTLWHVTNRLQESVIRGGFNLGERKARPITNPWTDLALNKGIWQLAEQYA